MCGPLVARDWLTSIRLNLEWFGRPVVVIAVTPPGRDVLPWDEERCKHKRRPHTHRGPKGCRVEQRLAREWSSHCAWRMRRLFDAAARRVVRATGTRPVLLERVWELQRRGVPHWHGVLPYGTPAERAAARVLVDALHELAPQWGFGHVDRKLEPKSGAEAAKYVAKYFLARRGRKLGVRETMREARSLDLDLPRSLLWQSYRALTRHTGYTIRALRRCRHALAAARGFCEWPRWQSREERTTVLRVLDEIYRRRGDAPINAPPWRPRPTLRDELLARDFGWQREPAVLIG